MKKIVGILFFITLILVIDVTRESNDTIIVYSSSEQFRNDKIQEMLDEKFPNDHIYVTYLSTGKVASKIDSEGKATDADIIIGLENAYMEKIKDNLDSIEGIKTLDYEEDMVIPGNKYVVWEKQAGSIIVNHAVLEKYNLPVPKTYEDLLKPEYRGLIAMPDPKTSGTGYFFYKGLVNEWGLDETLEYFDKLAINIKQFTESGSGPVQLLVQQEVAIGLGLTFQGVNEMNQGNEFEIIEPEFGSPYSLTGAGIIKGRRQKNKVEEVYSYIINEVLVNDKEYYSPDKILKEQENKVENYPQNIKYADMTGINDIEEKERLLEKWKY